MDNKTKQVKNNYHHENLKIIVLREFGKAWYYPRVENVIVPMTDKNDAQSHRQQVVFSRCP